MHLAILPQNKNDTSGGCVNHEAARQRVSARGTKRDLIAPDRPRRLASDPDLLNLRAEGFAL
jgi:hypothetical protein